jgi:hypothetical protein
MLLSESIRVLAEKVSPHIMFAFAPPFPLFPLCSQVAHISHQIEQQVNGTAPCSRALRRRAASIMQQLQRLQSMNFSERLQDVTANVDAARTLQASKRTQSWHGVVFTMFIAPLFDFMHGVVNCCSGLRTEHLPSLTVLLSP